MAFDDQTRRRLFKTVTACRNLLTEDFDDQLRGRFGIYADEGRVLEIDRLPGLDDAGREVAGLLRERIDHLAAGKGRQALGEAVHRLRREQAFTVLNRFAAVRMAEERDLISQSVGGGFQSRGFRVFEQAAGGTALGELYDRYRIYLDCLFDELSLDLGVLFDRSDAMGLLFPSEHALRALFDELNHPDIAPLWAEDETIGWIYQYYNDPEERKRMRDPKRGGSAAPRNSRELAVRNQFFTPRYVVEFLTDNTLGRIWYEMTKGETRLKEQCRYLVRRPVEIFLPGPDVNFWHDADGTEAFREFCGSADVTKLPEDPALGVLLGWVGSLKTLGFEEELRLIGLTHQEVMDRYLLPLEERETPSGLAEAHPILLLQILWRLAYEASKNGYGDLRNAASTDPIAGPAWEMLRQRLSIPVQGLSQDELLKLPVFVAHRSLKDPREIRLLDPACGSMHFGLYAFDLYEVIYEEAWQRGLVDANDFGGDTPPFPHESIRRKIVEKVHSNDLHEDIEAETARVVILNQSDMGDGLFHAGPYIAPPTRNYRPGVAREMALVDFDYWQALATGWLTHEEGERLVRETDAFEHARLDPLAPNEIYERFCRDVPRLIIEHNIHGIDIDPRAVQIAALSIWLRAQKAWKDQGVRAAERPQVRRSNIVCAEPMPGSAEMLEEFAATLDPPLLGKMVKNVFEKMQLAGEAGSLLKIEDEIRTAIETARKEWLNQQDDLLTRKGRSQEEFFETAEQQVIDVLRNYAERVDADSYQRRLFADDASRGFAFIDLCRKRYDGVVMNPPFGEPADATRQLFKGLYPTASDNLAVAFMERGADLLALAGLTSSITDCSWAKKYDYSDFRRMILSESGLHAIVHLGWEVLDNANVETNLKIRGRWNELAFTLNASGAENKAEMLASSVSNDSTQSFFPVARFSRLPNAVFAFEMRLEEFDAYATKSFVSNSFMTALAGVKSCNSNADFRTWWEVPNSQLGPNRDWQLLHNGSPYCPFHYPAFFVVRSDRGEWTQLMANGGARPGEAYYHRPGIAYGKRTDLMYGYVKPKEQVFSQEGQAIFPLGDHSLWEVLALANSSVFSRHANYVAGQHKYHNYLNKICLPLKGLPLQVVQNAKSAHELLRATDQSNENAHLFVCPSTNEDFLIDASSSFRLDSACSRFDKIFEIQASNDSAILEALQLPTDEKKVPSTDYYVHYFGASLSSPLIASTWLSYSVGAVFGRWDIRYATGERQPPELPDPVDPLPVCPPGMLQNSEGLPAGPKEVPADYPLPITWSGILVDDENHPEDIVARVREAIEVIWKGRADDIEAEACEILGVKAKHRENLDALRIYFRDPNRFFKEHLARYSKSRRKAPIYWPLSTESGSYTLWIYYHRLDSQTLYTSVSDFIDPKREAVGRTAEDLARRIGAGGSSEERQRLEDLTAFQAELKTLRDRLLEVAALPYRPNLNDGVQITAAPLWQCFRHSPWQKVLKDTWKELEKGKYDWAHLTLPIWPARVVSQCAKDRSLAIAHGFEGLLWVPDVSGKKRDQLRPLKAPEDEIKELIKAGHDKKDVDRAASDVDIAETLGLLDHLWVERPAGKWRRRLSPKEEIENEFARLRVR